MTTFVVNFCNQHNFQLDKRTADNWRQLPFSVTHRYMELGVCKEGITDGLHAYLWSAVTKEVTHVHWSNCVKADTGENAQYKTGVGLRKIKVNPAKESKPKKVSLKQQRLDELDRLLGL